MQQIKTLNTVAKGTKRWILNAGNRSDMERCTSEFVGKKFRRWILAWEIIRKLRRWTPIAYMDDRIVLTSQLSYAKGVGASTRRRAVRRLLYAFRTAGLVDIKPWPPQSGRQTYFRRKKGATNGSDLG